MQLLQMVVGHLPKIYREASTPCEHATKRILPHKDAYSTKRFQKPLPAWWLAIFSPKGS